MKKMFYIAAAAVAAMTACTQIENEVPQEEISFKTLALSTKALINPLGQSPATEAFPVDEAFGVYAIADGNFATPLMPNLKVDHSTGVWKATTTAVWPATGSVDFTAYYPYGAASFNENNSLMFSNLELGTAIGSQTDPLVAITNGLDATKKPVVGLTFKHISSQIDISVRNSSTDTELQDKIVLKSVVVKNVKTKASYTEGTQAGSGVWANYGANTNFTVFSGTRQLTADDTYVNGGAFTNSPDGSSAFVIIPETVLDPSISSNTAVQEIEVTYDTKAFKLNGYEYAAKENITKTIPVYGNIESNQFIGGKRYVFHLAFTLDGMNNEILFEPVVEGWDVEDVTSVVFEVLPTDYTADDIKPVPVTPAP